MCLNSELEDDSVELRSLNISPSLMEFHIGGFRLRKPVVTSVLRFRGESRPIHSTRLLQQQCWAGLYHHTSAGCNVMEILSEFQSGNCSKSDRKTEGQIYRRVLALERPLSFLICYWPWVFQGRWGSVLRWDFLIKEGERDRGRETLTERQGEKHWQRWGG